MPTNFQKAKRRLRIDENQWSNPLSYLTSSESVEMTDGIDLQTKIETLEGLFNNKIDKYTYISSPVDLNTLLESGVYSIPDLCTNRPSMNGGGQATVFVSAEPYSASGFIVQVLFNQLQVSGTQQIFYRIGKRGMQTTTFLPWNDISGGLNKSIARGFKLSRLYSEGFLPSSIGKIDYYGFGNPERLYPASSDYNKKNYLNLETGAILKCIQQNQNVYVWRDIDTHCSPVIEYIAQAIKSMWNLGSYSDITLKYSFGNPNGMYPSNEQGSNAYCLDVLSGIVYKITRTDETTWSWVQQEQLTLVTSGKFDKTGGTISGDVRLKGSGNYGSKLNFGDGDYAYISEPSDDALEIRASSGIYIKDTIYFGAESGNSKKYKVDPSGNATFNKLSSEALSGNVTYTSGDAADSSVSTSTGWTSVSKLTSGLSLATLFERISTMIKNVRWLYKMVSELNNNLSNYIKSYTTTKSLQGGFAAGYGYLTISSVPTAINNTNFISVTVTSDFIDTSNGITFHPMYISGGKLYLNYYLPAMLSREITLTIKIFYLG